MPIHEKTENKTSAVCCECCRGGYLPGLSVVVSILILDVDLDRIDLSVKRANYTELGL